MPRNFVGCNLLLLMPPNHSNSKSTLSRQMQHLRTQVDRIDLEILKLLQQRTKLSRRIGETKRRHGAVIYVPDRERELLRRVDRLTRGKLPPRSVAAIFREILSSSRAAQGQAAIGLLRSSESSLLPMARWCFGACDEFLTFARWSEILQRLRDGSLALALLTGAELAAILRAASARREFLETLTVAGDFAPSSDRTASLDESVFIIIPKTGETIEEANRVLVLIECKSNTNAVKSWIKSMSERSIQVDETGATHSARPLLLARLSAERPINVDGAFAQLQSARVPFSIAGIYGGTGDYAR
jgi:chorismate mutase-like protein